MARPCFIGGSATYGGSSRTTSRYQVDATGIPAQTPLSATRAAPEGVYVYDTGAFDHLRLFDRDGNYVKTVYPFSADKVDKVVGLVTHKFPQDGQAAAARPLPFKQGFEQSTLLFGRNADTQPSRLTQTGLNATAMSVRDGKIALAGTYVSRLATDGTTAGQQLAGPEVRRAVRLHGTNADSGHAYYAYPTSDAISPDGKWLYLAGFMWRYPWHNDTLNGVMRMPLDGNAQPEPFLGSMKQDDSGTGPGQFRGAASVACDSQGRIYVADHINDRIQVFDAGGKHLKDIAVFRPAVVCVHPKTGEIYAFSWMTPNRFNLTTSGERDKAHEKQLEIVPKLFSFGTFDNPKPRDGSPWALPLPKFGGKYNEWWNLPPIQTVGEIDFWADKLTVWISRATDESFHGEWDKRGVLVLREQDGKLEVLRDFAAETVKTVARATPPMLDRQRLYVNPKTEKLYVGEADSGVGKSFKELIEISPATGKVKLVQLPYAAEDIAFDVNGLIYLRSDNSVVRYDMASWREIPWDYGEERDNVGFDGFSPPITAALITPGHRSPSFWHMGGVYVSPRGHVAVACPNTIEAGKRVPGHVFSSEHKESAAAPTGRPYVPPIFPGRQRWGEIHIFDQHGKLVVEDALPGLGHCNGMGIDQNDNVYVMANGHRVIGGKCYDPAAPDDLSETLIKARPKAAKVLSGSGSAAVPLDAAGRPKRSVDFMGFPTGPAWVEGADWLYGGVGYTGNAPWDGGGCRCWNARFCLDYFARSFAPEIRHFTIAVLDSNGNLITRIGRYGNVDDGAPLVSEPGGPPPRSIGGDEVALFHAAYVGAHTDRRLFIADAGNARIVSVKLDYHATESVRVPGK